MNSSSTGRSLVNSLLYLALAVTALVAIPAAVLRKPVGDLSWRDAWILALVAAGYGVSFLWLVIRRRRSRNVSVWELLAVTSVALVPVVLATAVLYRAHPRPLLIQALLLALFLLLLLIAVAWRLKGWLPVVLAAVLATIGIGLQVMLAGADSSAATKQGKRTEAQLGSALYDLSVVSYMNYFPAAEARQGGISTFDDGYILVDGDGNLFLFRQATDGRNLEVQRLPHRVPMNREAFETAGGPTVGKRTWFRVADVLTQQIATGYRIFVTHHYWKDDESCWVLRVSGLEGGTAEFLTSSASNRWYTVFDSQPCVPLALDGDRVHFSGLNNGGRMVLLDDTHLLVSIGDHEMDGYATTWQASQDPVSSYGKTVLVDLVNRQAEIFSLGHRNPQGLALASDGTIWETEHGPQGGDELNRIGKGANYGWPLETYGTEYGTHAWPVAEIPGSHERFEQPYYAWVPSIGTSNLTEIRGDPFALWRGDLVVSSLRGRSLWRLRVRDDRVVMAEQIEFGERIRDVQIGHGGELVLLADGNSIHFIVPTEGAATGQSLYRVCAGCHVPPAGSNSAIGPVLAGIVGREVASVRGFDYSNAMRGTEGDWTPERLDAFLEDPASAVPGTTMLFNGIRDPAARRALIDYMAAPESRLDERPGLPD